MPPLHRKVNPSLPGDATPTCHEKPDEPVSLPLAEVRHPFLVNPPAAVPVLIREMMPGMVGGKLLRAGHGVPWTGGFRDFLVQLVDEVLLNRVGPVIEIAWKIVRYTITTFS